MPRRFNGARRERAVRQFVPLAALILVFSLTACGRDLHSPAPASPATAMEEQPLAHIAVKIPSIASPENPNGSVTGFHVNAAALQLRIEAPDIPEYAIHLPVTTFDNVITVPVGAARTFHLEVENHWGLAIYQSSPQIVDLTAGEKQELLFNLQPIETILPLATASAVLGEETILTVEEEDSPLQDLRLTIPSDSLSQSLWVSLDEVYNVSHIPAPERQASVIIDIQPHDMRLTSSATLTLPYYQALVARLQLPESHLRISFFDTSKQRWQPLARQVIDLDANTATAQLDQFGLFVLTIGEEPLPQLLANQHESPPVPTTPAEPQDREPLDLEVVETLKEDGVAETVEAHETAEAVAERTVVEAIEVVAPNPPAEPIAWRNERVTLKMRPYQRGSIGIILRYQDSRSHYRFVWELASQRAHFIKYYRGQRTRLKSVSLPYLASQTYPLAIVTASDAFTISVDGKLIFYLRDGDIPSGTVALNCTGGASRCFDQVQIH